MADTLLVIQITAAVLATLYLYLWCKAPGRAWRWHTGDPLDGKHITNATWIKPHTKVLHPTGNASRFHKAPRLARTAIRGGLTVCAWFVLVLTVFFPLAMLVTFAVVLAASIGVALWQAWRKVSPWLPSRHA
jgi:hypothetical protein